MGYSSHDPNTWSNEYLGGYIGYHLIGMTRVPSSQYHEVKDYKVLTLLGDFDPLRRWEDAGKIIEEVAIRAWYPHLRTVDEENESEEGMSWVWYFCIETWDGTKYIFTHEDAKVAICIATAKAILEQGK